MRRALIVGGDPPVGRAAGVWLRQHDGDRVSAAPARLGTIGTTRCLRKPLEPSSLLGVIDDCLSEAEPQRRIVAALSAVAGARFRTAGAAMV